MIVTPAGVRRGPAYAEVPERSVPGALEEAVADADTFFGQELPAVRSWSFGPEETSRVTQVFGWRRPTPPRRPASRRPAGGPLR
jgi:hypothetical protein